MDILAITQSHDRKVQLDILEELTFEEYASAAKNFLKSGRMLWYISGNLAKQAAVDIVNESRKVWQITSTSIENLSQIRAIAMKPSSHFVYERELVDPKNTNSCLLTYFELG